MTVHDDTRWDARRARLAVAAAFIVTAACVTVAVAVPDPPIALLVPVLYVPSTIGVLLLWRASIYHWRYGAQRPRSFVVDRGAFLLLPARATIRAVAMILAVAFPAGHVIIQARAGEFGVLEWAIAALGVVIAGLAILHGVFLWRGRPRPLVAVTPGGVTAAGFFGSVSAPWAAFQRDYASWPDLRMSLGLPVYEGTVRKGLRPYGVQTPRDSEPFRVPATWATNPWWAAQALAVYWKGRRDRKAIGTAAENAGLSAFLLPYRSEIDEQLSRFR